MGWNKDNYFNIRLLDGTGKELKWRDGLLLSKTTPREYMRKNLDKFPPEAKVMVVGISPWDIIRPEKQPKD